MSGNDQKQDPIAIFMSNLLAVKGKNNGASTNGTKDHGGLLLTELTNPTHNNYNASTSEYRRPSNDAQPVVESNAAGMNLLSALLAGRKHATVISQPESEVGQPAGIEVEENIKSEPVKPRNQNLVGPVSLSMENCGRIIVDVDSIDRADLELMEEHTVATLRREVAYYPGKLVASNGAFIAYSSKKGVRVIQQSDGNYSLLNFNDLPVVDVALSPILLDGRSRLAAVSSDGSVFLVDIHQVAEDEDMQSHVLLQVESPVATKSGEHVHQITRAQFSPDGKFLLLVAQNSLFEIVIDAISTGVHEKQVDYLRLSRAPFVREHRDKMTSITCADYVTSKNEIMSGFADGSVQLFSSVHPDHGRILLFPDTRHHVSSVCAVEVSPEESLVLVGFQMNRILFLIDPHTAQVKQEIVIKSASMSFVNYLFHRPTSSLYLTSSASPALVRFELLGGVFEPKDMWSLPAIPLSINAEAKTLDDLELFVVFEKVISIFTIPSTSVEVEAEEEYVDDQIGKLENEVSTEIGQRLFDEAISAVTRDVATKIAAKKQKEDYKNNVSSPKQQIPREQQEELFKQVTPSDALQLKLPPGIELEFVIESIVNKKLAGIPQDLGTEMNAAIAAKLEERLTEKMDAIVGLHLAAFAEKLNTTLSSMVRNAVESSIKRQQTSSDISGGNDLKNTGKLSSLISQSVTASISKDMSELMSGNFESVLIPAYQAATQVMFKQMQGAFQQGLNSVMQDFKVSLLKSIDTATNPVTSNTNAKPTSAADSITKQLQKSSDRQMKILEDISLRLSKLESARASEVVSPVGSVALGYRRSIRDEIRDLLGKGEYETAFTKALESSQLDVVIDLLSLISPNQVFLVGGHSVLSQPVLLSLSQQLALSLASSDKIEMKFIWMQECLASIDPKHPVTGEYSKQVLPLVIINLEQWIQRTSREYPENPNLITAKLLIRLGSSLCQNL